jgi:hypothetical protein
VGVRDLGQEALVASLGHPALLREQRKHARRFL